MTDTTTDTTTDTLTAEGLTIAPLVVPASLDAADAGPFLDFVRLGNAVCRHDAGHDYLDQEPAEALGFWQDEQDWIHVGFCAQRDGEVVGVSSMTLTRQPGAATAEFDLIVDPDRWGEGIEEALLAETEAEVRRQGRSMAQTYTLHRPGSTGPALTPTTGWGSVPAQDRQTRFMLDHGYGLEQVERNSALDLTGSFEAVERSLADALAVAGADYRQVSWTSPTPDEHLDTFAYVLSRMSTDAPQGGLTIEEETWDAARVRRRDARLQAQGLTVSVAAVAHVPTGAIVAYNELVIGSDRTGATQQYGTLVLKEHRGHRLGTIVKCANLLRWRDVAPESPRVSTFNAEENRPMLDINEAIGFVAVSYAGAWQKVLQD